MKEYTAQMKVRKKWISARWPNSGGGCVSKDRDIVATRMAAIRKAWADYAERNKERKDFHMEMIPTEFRIASRRITEWKED